MSAPWRRDRLSQQTAERDALAAVSPEGREVENSPISVSGWSRVARGNKPLWIVATVSVVCLVAGYAGGAFLSPAGAADASTDGGPITVPVESRALSNEVILRGDAAFDDAVEVQIAAGELEGPAVVTGAVPKVGDTLNALNIALEVAGRPVIVLPGALPAYRTLRAGHSGPDVDQLKKALRSVGLDPGETDIYDSSTADAVKALYDKVGYAPPTGSPEAVASVEGAEEAVAAAEQSLASAERELATASKGADAAQRVELENVVREAQRELATARGAGDKRAISRAEDALRLAQTQRDIGLAAPDTSAQAEAVSAARQSLESANADLVDASTAALTPLPSNEVLFLPTLPRRIDEVNTEHGKILDGAAMVVSGATLSVTASASQSESELLKEGATASIGMPDGTDLDGKVRTVKAREADADADADEQSGPRWDVILELKTPTKEQVEQLRGQSVRVTVPVEATAGKVLAVPSAALSAGPGGDTRIEIFDDGKTRFVPVKTGLAAEGLVEISGDLKAGDLVVVGK